MRVMNMSELVKLDLESEHTRLNQDSVKSSAPQGFVVSFHVKCSPGDAAKILSDAKDVLRIINKNSFGNWPSLEGWSALLPNSFVATFTPDESGSGDDGWTLEDWIYWFEPNNRVWFWWDAPLLGVDALTVSILVYEHPFAWESLEVLFKQLGAIEIEEAMG